MAYKKFTMAKLYQDFHLQEVRQSLFHDVPLIPISDWLQKTLQLGFTAPLSSEKAKSERIISPILFELKERNQHSFQIFSGTTLDGDKKQGLIGECDFILSNKPQSHFLRGAIFALVEAKDDDMESGLPQCIAQMLGASLLNQKYGDTLPFIYGCITTGDDWQFLKLVDTTILIDTQRYYLNKVEEILGVLQLIVNQFHLSR